MKKTQRLLALPALLATAVLVACEGAGPAGPMMDFDNQLMGAQAKKDKSAPTVDATVETTAIETADAVELLTRAVPLANDVSTSKVIGRAGGWIISWQGGVSLWVPAGALKKDVEITVTALAGDKVAFDFQPHGLSFHEPVRIGIVKGTGFAESEAFGVYYDGDPKNNPKVLEFFPVFDWDGFTVLETTHFSGYALASGSRGGSVLSGASF